MKKRLVSIDGCVKIGRFFISGVGLVYGAGMKFWGGIESGAGIELWGGLMSCKEECCYAKHCNARK